jgi:hypothetical protein
MARLTQQDAQSARGFTGGKRPGVRVKASPYPCRTLAAFELEGCGCEGLGKLWLPGPDSNQRPSG